MATRRKTASKQGSENGGAAARAFAVVVVVEDMRSELRAVSEAVLGLGDRFERRFDAVDVRFDAVDLRLDRLEHDVAVSGGHAERPPPSPRVRRSSAHALNVS